MLPARKQLVCSARNRENDYIIAYTALELMRWILQRRAALRSRLPKALSVGVGKPSWTINGARKRVGPGSVLCPHKHMTKIAMRDRLLRNFPNDIAPWRQHCMQLHASRIPFADLRCSTSGEMTSPFRSPLEVTARRLSFLVGQRWPFLGWTSNPDAGGYREDGSAASSADEKGLLGIG